MQVQPGMGAQSRDIWLKPGGKCKGKKVKCGEKNKTFSEKYKQHLVKDIEQVMEVKSTPERGRQESE